MNFETVDLRSLVQHSEAVQATETVERAQALFAERGVDFLAVARGHDLVGVCAKRDLNRQLSSRFGFALFAQRPVTELLLPAPLRVARRTPIADVFTSASAREVGEFFDDVLLVDDQGRYLGMIPMRTLVRLQTEFLLQNNAGLEASRAEIAAKNRAIEEDIAMAREVQLALLPTAQAPVSAGGRTLTIEHRYLAASGMSGDFYDVIRVSPCATGILVCDVMGHGVRSALITSMVRAMIEELRPIAEDPGLFLTRLNRDLTRVLRQAGGLIFVTAAYVVLEVAAGRLRYAQAGHPTPLHCDADSQQWTSLACPPEAQGPALGLMDEFSFPTVSAAFAPGSRLVVFTDGVFEAANASGEEFGLERLAAALPRRGQPPLGALIDGVLQAVATFSGQAWADDVCLVALELTALPAPLAAAHGPKRAALAARE